MDQQLIERLRESLHLEDADISDREATKLADTTTVGAAVQLGLAIDRFVQVVLETPVAQRLHKILRTLLRLPKGGA